MDHSFQVTQRQLEQAIILDLNGELAHQAEQALLELWAWEQGLEGGRRFLVLNFTGVSYINSMGIAVLIRLVRALPQPDCLAFAYGLTAHYQKLFRMVGLLEHIAVYPNEVAVMQRIGHMQ